MKYLGLTLDSRWGFEAHFNRLAPRLKTTVVALSGLLPNLGGLSRSCRLYEWVVRSMALYGPPVWLDALGRRENLSRLRASQRIIATRVARGYRTIFYKAACVLAGSMPWDLVAGTHSIRYRWRTDLRGRGARPAPKAMRDLRSHLYGTESVAGSIGQSNGRPQGRGGYPPSF